MQTSRFPSRWLPALLIPIVCLAGSATALAADNARQQRDVPYAVTGKAAGSTSLDIYAPAAGKDLPIVIWIHGGGWRRGDKAGVQLKPRAFNEQGFVLVSINYRLVPEATVKEQAGDIAQAIRWVHDHAGEFGGSLQKIFLMGHSAGAHLAALVATDPRYLKQAGRQLSDLSGVILLDGAGYDVPRQMAAARLPQLKELYRTAFGDDPAVQREVSPITHVAQGRGIPPFLILHVADRRDSREQSQALADKLQAAGTGAEVVAAEGKSHATINRELGAADDPPTKKVFKFLREQLKPGKP